MPRPRTTRTKKEPIATSDHDDSHQRVPRVSSGISKVLSWYSSYTRRCSYLGEREHLFAPEQEEWQGSKNQGRTRTRFGRRTDSTFHQQEPSHNEISNRPMEKSSGQRSRNRRHRRSSSKSKSKDRPPKNDQPMISARARKTTS